MLQLAVTPLLQHSFHLCTCIFLTDDSRINYRNIKQKIIINKCMVFRCFVCVDQTANNNNTANHSRLPLDHVSTLLTSSCQTLHYYKCSSTMQREKTTHAHAHAHTHTYTYTHIYIHIHTHTHTRTHTHTHTQTNKQTTKILNTKQMLLTQVW